MPAAAPLARADADVFLLLAADATGWSSAAADAISVDAIVR